MRRGALVRLALLALVWGSSYLWIKIALRGFTPTQILLVRLALGALVLLAAVRFSKLRLPRGAMVWVHLSVAALLANVVPFLLFAVGEQTVDSGLAGALNATTPLWALLVGLFAGRQRARPTPALLGGLAVGFTGALLILAPWNSGSSGPAMVGVLACLAAALSYALGYTYIDRTLAGRGIPPVALVAAQLLAATVIAAVTTPFAGLTPVDLRADSVIALVVLGALGTGYAVLLNHRLIEDDGATLASTAAYLLPIVAVALGALTLGEPVTAVTLAGVALVLSGIALTRRRRGGGDAATSSAEPDAAKLAQSRDPALVADPEACPSRASHGWRSPATRAPTGRGAS